MDSEQIKTIIFIGIAAFIGGSIRGLIQAGHRPTPETIARVVVLSLIAIGVGFLIIRNLK
ncbi:MAG: hypothetical protein KKB82_03520 [Candidatus Omnitrophica bacterium]|nr:hypothetical protein [Candidatus Omnitrophota bacterium]MBU1924976.1 hypothetical protein [Candidatus Omnitrophota bacterium]MBU2062848.1 hypothetical protein [Candidatus Omnitrophota bacterium]